MSQIHKLFRQVIPISKYGGEIMILKPIVAIILLSTALIVPALGQTSASDWVTTSNNLLKQGKYNESIQASEKAIELDPTIADAWSNKAGALGNLVSRQLCSVG
jgi:tetratricopeptide (TPR) repeat protein